MDIGIICFPYERETVIDAAKNIDAAGAPVLFGLGDNPYLFDEAYVMQQAILERTSNIMVGPFCTNPVQRHWSVHSGAHKTLAALYGPRTFIALGAGDSSVHSVGLRPATGAAMAEHLRAVREHGPEGLRIVMTVGGLKSAAQAGRVADDIVIGQGIDEGATASFTEAALEARRAEGIDKAPRRWLYVLVDLQEPGAAEDREEDAKFHSILMSYSRQALAITYAGKNVPEHMQETLKELYSKFSYERYGGEENARLIEEFAEEGEFITRRFGMSGTPAEVAEQMRAATARTGVDGIWVNLVTRRAARLGRALVEECLAREGSAGTPAV